MKVVKVDIPKVMDIYILGDTHYPRGRRKKFQKVINEIKKNKNAYMIGLGDWVENIVAGDPRYSPEEMAELIKQYQSPVNMVNVQWMIFENDIKPLIEKNKILGLHSGNHESNFTRRYSYNALKQLCDRNDIEYLGDGMALFELKYKDKLLRILTYHGSGGGLTTGYALSKLEYYSQILDDIDIMAVGHTHKLAININADRLKYEDDKFKQKIQYHCSCGSFLGNYDLDTASYAERKGYKPLPIGYIKIHIENGEIKSVVPVPC